MRPDNRPKSSSEEDDEGKFYMKPSFPGRDKPPLSRKKKHNKVVSTQVNTKLKRHREDKFQGFLSSSKKKKTSKKRLDKSGVDLEELLARTYPKKICTSVEHPKQSLAEGSSRRSSRKKKRSGKIINDSSKKWSGDEEIFLAMALLKCASPEGEINKTAFYQEAKERLHFDVSNPQLYDKMRSMRKRFRVIQSKLKEQNIPEDEFPYRTPQEPALFTIWKQIWGNDGDNQEIDVEDSRENDVQNLRVIEYENPREDGDECPREIEYESPREIENEAENIRENGAENIMEIEGKNSKVNDAEKLSEFEAVSPAVNNPTRGNPGETEGKNPRGIGAKNCRGIEGENYREIGSENPRRNEFTNPRDNEFTNPGENGEEEEEEQQNIQKSPSLETLNVIEKGRSKLPQSQSVVLEDNIKIMLENTESKLRASIESLFNRVAVSSAAAANFQPFGGFGIEVGMGSFLLRRMEELMDGVNSVKEFPGLDAAEAKELQQKWYMLKIQELRMFCDSLELLQKQCRLFLTNVETSSSSDNHKS